MKKLTASQYAQKLAEKFKTYDMAIQCVTEIEDTINKLFHVLPNQSAFFTLKTELIYLESVKKEIELIRTENLA